MGFLAKVNSKVEHHVPLSIRVIAKEFSKPNVSIGAFRGRAITFGLSIVSASEAIVLLALGVLTKIINSITRGKLKDLDHLSTIFLNQSKDRSLSSIYLLYGTIINPERALTQTLDIFDEMYENPEVLQSDHQKYEEMAAEEEERLAEEARKLFKKENFLYSFRL